MVFVDFDKGVKDQHEICVASVSTATCIEVTTKPCIDVAKEEGRG